MVVVVVVVVVLLQATINPSNQKKLLDAGVCTKLTQILNDGGNDHDLMEAAWGAVW